MSMLSSQIDRLRKAAQTYRGFGNHTMEQMLLGAADTIWQLRDDLQRANAENAKLRVERDEWRRVAVSKQDIIDHMRNANAENAKLREFATDLWRFTKTACERYPRLFDPLAPGGQIVQLNAIESFEQRFHEVVGVGLDGDQV